MEVRDLARKLGVLQHSQDMLRDIIEEQSGEEIFKAAPLLDGIKKLADELYEEFCDGQSWDGTVKIAVQPSAPVEPEEEEPDNTESLCRQIDDSLVNLRCVLTGVISDLEDRVKELEGRG